jgi:hypothetical protein
MTKLGSIKFDDRILDALRDESLAVFAGAGVSMGPPSSLDDFPTLVSKIAQRPGHEITGPLDRFLGQMHHVGMAVHERAAQLLSPAGSEPNALHYDLLKIFRTVEKIRVVTTNFDLHFEAAANRLFGEAPEVYRAPALPLGYDFTGIVHVHGALPRAKELVLTDADFGRAYLTEGWARRFLVDVFRRYTVLFVGYRHDDVVMNYLARALPADGVAGRYVLTDTGDNWELLGITPIRFKKSIDADEYSELYEGVNLLAERSCRGVLDWQSRLAELGSRTPPTDEEAIGEVEQALRELHTTRFILNFARDPEWLRWLDARKYLDSLFTIGDLSERDQLLVGWLAENFAIEHADMAFEILAAHNLQMNPLLWWSIGRELGVATDKPLPETALKRWITIMLGSAPVRADRHVLMWLAERSNSQGCVDLVLKLFIAMGKHKLSVKPRFELPEEEDNENTRHIVAECPLHVDHWAMNEVWTKHLQIHLDQIARPLISGVARCLEDIHHDLKAWDMASRDWDPVSYRRSAIEAHEQDQFPEAIDVLIDAARDALDWIGSNATDQLSAWTETLVNSDVPLLRRLALYAITVHPSQSSDERLRWILDRVGLHEFLEHHEIHRAVALSYASATDEARQAVVQAVLAHTLQASDNFTSEERTARAHFNWLTWLVQAKPDCSSAELALTPIRAKYPNWLPSDYPDFTSWTGSGGRVGSQSPWSVQELLAHEPSKKIDELINFKGSHFDGPDREGLLSSLRDACKENVHWAFSLAESLVERKLWSSDLWSSALRGVREADLTIDDWRDVFNVISRPELFMAQAYNISQLLYALVRDGGKVFALEILEQANVIALPLWKALEPNAKDEDVNDWLSIAINRPAGVIVEFWINGLALLMRGKSGADRVLPDNYRQWFTMVAQDTTIKGGMGRSLLASQTAFLSGLDEEWTHTYVLPLFSDSDPKKFAQAWDGFLVWGRLNPALVDALLPAFMEAIRRLGQDLPTGRRRFMEFYAALAVLHVADPTQQLLPVLFQNGVLEDRISFASHFRFLLQQMQSSAKRELWDRWLNRYWQDRLQGIPAVLDEAEIREMLEWLPCLGEVFPAAVHLATRFKQIRIEHAHLLYALRESELVTEYPSEVADLLIYLCNCVVGYHRDDLATINARMPELPPGVRQRLNEALARAGVTGTDHR